MEEVTGQLTVFFENPFWVAVCERTGGGRYEVCRAVFGAEPRDYEVFAFFNQNYSRLRFSPSLEAAELTQRHISPKRMQREINRQLAYTGVGTKAQQALKLQQEEGKQARRKASRAEREAEKDRRLELHREKQKEKHRGH